MLKGILDGKTYVAVAQESGLSRSAVEQRVKALARDRTRSIPTRSAKILLLAQETAAVSQSSWTGLIHLLRSTAALCLEEDEANEPFAELDDRVNHG
jgi:hypothetical protein